MYLLGLRNVKRQMDRLGTKIEPIPFEYNKKGFSCVFNSGVVPFQLIMTTIGLRPRSFWFDVITGYLLVPHLSENDMLELIRYLDLKPSDNHKFTIKDLMLAFNRQAGKHIIKVVQKENDSKSERNNDEKPYFLKWQHNKKNHVTWENLEKTERYIGKEEREYCEKNNISSCWGKAPSVYSD